MKYTLTAAVAALSVALPLATIALADTALDTGIYYAAPFVAVPQGYTLDIISGGCGVETLGQITGSAYGLFEQLKACPIAVYGDIVTQSPYSPYVFDYATADNGGEQG